MTYHATTRRCPACGGMMRRAVRNETVTFQGHSLTYEQPGWHCEACDEGVLEGDDNAFHDAALHEVMARAKGSPAFTAPRPPAARRRW
jgi:YgiT-type zinc finger domain-containing protein